MARVADTFQPLSFIISTGEFRIPGVQDGYEGMGVFVVILAGRGLVLLPQSSIS